MVRTAAPRPWATAAVNPVERTIATTCHAMTRCGEAPKEAIAGAATCPGMKNHGAQRAQARHAPRPEPAPRTPEAAQRAWEAGWI